MVVTVKSETDYERKKIIKQLPKIRISSSKYSVLNNYVVSRIEQKSCKINSEIHNKNAFYYIHFPNKISEEEQMESNKNPLLYINLTFT